MTTPIAPGRELDKLDRLIVVLFRDAGARGLTLVECGEQVMEYVARSNDPELQALADADPQFRYWRALKLPSKSETQ